MLNTNLANQSLSAFANIHDAPIAVFGHLWRLLHIIYYFRCWVPYEGKYIAYCVKEYVSVPYEGHFIMLYNSTLHKKMKFSIKNFFSKCDQIRRKLQICSHSLKKSLMQNFIFCAVLLPYMALAYLKTIWKHVTSYFFVPRMQMREMVEGNTFCRPIPTGERRFVIKSSTFFTIIGKSKEHTPSQKYLRHL